jgi:hypothetical protein
MRVLLHLSTILACVTEPVRQAKEAMRRQFDIKDMGEMKFFLGQEVQCIPGKGILLTQTKYAREVLQRFGMWDCTPKATPLEVGHRLCKNSGEVLRDEDPRKATHSGMVGSLLYLAGHTRPDLSYAVGVLSRFMSQPTDKHFMAAKRVLRYLRGTYDHGIMYPCKAEAKIQGVQTYTETDFREMGVGREPVLKLFSDADLGGDFDKRRSTSGMVVTLHGRAVLWAAKLQTVVATSTAEAEYISASMAVKTALWVRKILSEIWGRAVPMPLLCDNQSALQMMTQHTSGYNGRTKHIDLTYHFIRDRYHRGDISVMFVSSNEQMADAFTKALPGAAFGTAMESLMGFNKR